MTNTAGVQRPAPKIGRVSRWKLTEPVALYTAPTLVLLALCVLVPVAVSGAWAALAVLVPALGLHGFALWCARASTYSPAGMMQALREAFDNR